jgi:nicotinamide phosphoribosyltransferase
MSNWLNNICCLTDSYKVTHWRQYPAGTRRVFSYFESRSGATFDETVFFGLQYFLKQYMVGEVVTEAKLAEAEQLYSRHFGRNLLFREGWERIIHVHGGRLPVTIEAVPEGTSVGVNNVLMTVENTDSELFWLPNYLESLLVQTWYPCTVATLGKRMKSLLRHHFTESGSVSNLPWSMHDFGFRGTTCPEQAALGGAAHLVNFAGTDNGAALLFHKNFYHDACSGFSVPASEHSTMLAFGKDGESEAYENMLDAYPEGTVSVVSDSYDIYKACGEIWGGKLRDKVLHRDGVLVVRPDSGNPPEVVVKVLEILGEKFGYSINSQSYKVLHPKVRVLQGDGIDLVTLKAVLEACEVAGWSADNVSFGSGGGLLQKMNRDTQRFAFKAASVVVGCEQRDIFKRPATDVTKASKSGRIKLVSDGVGFVTVGESDPRPSLLRPVFRDGELLADDSLSVIRERTL